MTRTICTLVLALVVAAANAVAADAAVGAYKGAGCTGRDRVTAFESWLGRPAEVVLDGAAQDNWGTMVSSTKWSAQCWRNSGKLLVFSLPMLPKDGGRSTLDAGARGAYNDYIRQMAQALVDQGHGNAVVRIGWEFNASWFSWNSLKNPEAWKAYWRQIVTTMRAVPGAQFQFDWCFIVHSSAPSPEPAYPGDEYVDIIGADVYNGNWNPQLTAEQRWRMVLKGTYGLEWHRKFAAAHGKQMSYPEWGTGTRPDGKGGGDDAVFMRNMAQWISSNPVKYHVYWDYKSPDYDGRLSNGSQPQSEAEFLKAFGGRR